MSVLADKILEILEQKRGESISGEELAQVLSVTRGAVWKAIRTLRERGHQIEAVTNRGYCLSPWSDLLTAAAIRQNLDEKYRDIPIDIAQIVTSTNDIAKSAILQGAVHGSIFLAEEQTAGRGRRGREFFSPARTGLYMSVVLKPLIQTSDAVLYTLATAVVVCRVLEEELDIKPQIKWVNDIFYNNKKVCGILTEASSDVESGMIESLVVGIGINVTTTEESFPDQLQTVAGSVTSGKCGFIRARLAARIVSELLKETEVFSRELILKEYKERSFMLGQDILFYEKNAWHKAHVLDIDENGGLIIMDSSHNRRTLYSGDISVKQNTL